jgi:hypothetical protein
VHESINQKENKRLKVDYGVQLTISIGL